MHKEIADLAEGCGSCTRYDKNAKFVIPKNATKPLPLLTQPAQQSQLDYARSFEDHKRKKIFSLVAIDKYSTEGKLSIKLLCTNIDTHGVP